MPTDHEPTATMAALYPPANLRRRASNMAHLFFVCVLFTVIVTGSRCDSAEESSEPNDFHRNPFHVVWLSKAAKFDFVFNLNETIRPIPRLTSNYEANFTKQCTGHKACLFQDSKLLRIYQLDRNLNQTASHPFVFKLERSIGSSECLKSRVYVYSHCSTHWNPPIHTYGGNCDHTIEWHAPIACPSESQNHQMPCYAHDDSGQLVDLTRLIKSDGSSYQVAANNHTQVKDFHINICNEASESCGPNVSSCYTGEHGLVESGFNNLTSIAVKNKTLAITSFGEYNKDCSNHRVKTVVNLICSKNVTQNHGPQLVNSSNCENIVDWHTVQACPLPDIQVPSTTCVLQNNDLGINIDLKLLTNNQTIVKVPQFELNGANYTMMLGLCRGIRPATLKCENKSSSTTSACLIEDLVSSTGNSTKTNVTGSITKSFIRLADNRIYLESIAVNKSCQVSNNSNLTVTKPIGTRVEFYCSPKANVTEPKFLAFEDCTYVLEWPSASLCTMLSDDSTKQTLGTRTNQTTKISKPQPSTILNKPIKTAKTDSSITLDQKSKTGSEKHRGTLNEAKSMGVKTKKVEESLPGDKNAVETTIHVTKLSETNPQSLHDVQGAASATDIRPTYRGDRMNNVQKFFMVGLIVMSMGAFIVVIFLLDRRTQDGGSPIDRMLQPWKVKPSLFVEDSLRGRTRRRRDDDGGSIGLIEAEDP